MTQGFARYGFALAAALFLAIVAASPLTAYLTRLGGDVALPFAVGRGGDERPAAAVALIVIDEATRRAPPFSEAPQAAWTPQMATVLNAVAAAGPMAVGLNAVSSQSLDSPAYLPGFDRAFIEALSGLGQARRLVLADGPVSPAASHQAAAGGEDSLRPTAIAPDIDGVVRSYPVKAARAFGPSVATFAAELAERAGRRPTRPFLIDFRRAPDEIPAFRLADLHRCLEAGDLAPFQALKGKVVLVGEADQRHLAANRFFGDTAIKVRSPGCAAGDAPAADAMGGTTPRLLLQALAVDTIIRGAAPLPMSGLMAFAASFALFLGLCTAFLHLRPVFGAALWAVVTAALFAIGADLMAKGTLAPWPQWVGGGLILLAAARLYRTRIEEAAKRRLSRAFGGYLSPALVRQIADDPQSPRLEGEHRTVAVMFTDLEGFTAFSEQHAAEPEKIVGRLNALFSRIADIVERHGGYVDKFLGDGVMAVWGAPLSSRQPGLDAARAAVAIADAFDALAIQAAAEDGLPLRIRIGLSAGTVLAGELGAGRRTAYTVIGEPANRASRLQEACKAYEAGILADGAFVATLGGAFETRLVAQAVLRGQVEPVEIWALLRTSGPLPPYRLGG